MGNYRNARGGIEMVYDSKNLTPELEDELFRNPTMEYRGIPFWGWNCKITKEKIDRQLDYFKEMGFGGVDIHPRIGLDTEYLGDEYLEMVHYTVKRCKEKGLFCWLYDEDRYPSGVAGGFVTENKRFAARGLLLTERYREEAALQGVEAEKEAENSWMLPGYADGREQFEQMLDSGIEIKGYFAAAYIVELENGSMKEYRRLQTNQEIKKALLEGKRIRFAYVKLAECEARFQNNPYVDTLNCEATKRFLELTHEKYRETVGEDFGKAVPAIFTDEPRISFGRNAELVFADSKQDIMIPYTESFAEKMKIRFGVEAFDIVLDFVWNRIDGIHCRNRYLYREMLAECFSDSYMDEISKWCKEHNIAMTGHVLSEENLQGQTQTAGECMRCYRNMDFPGVDVLIDNREYSTVKQAVSISRQKEKKGTVSELYGVTHWDCSFKKYKLQGDWQAALGITVRVPHLSWMSMEGEAKRDWPASIFYQSPWYREWNYIENHFARLNTVLTRGKAICHIGVIHPVETMWLHQGPLEQTMEKQKELEKNFSDFNQWLLMGTQDFDYISEALLPEDYEICREKEMPKLRVGAMKYTMILVPFMETMRSTTLQVLEMFQKAGGKLIFLEKIPFLVDAKKSKDVKNLAEKSICISGQENALLKAVEEVRVLEIRKKDGSRSDNLIYQLREDKQCKWLFLCHVNEKKQHISDEEQYICRLRGIYKLTEYDTITGGKKEMASWNEGEWTCFFWNCYAQDSLLLRLDKTKKEKEWFISDIKREWKKQKEYHVVQRLETVENFSCEEPNLLLLDHAEYQLENGRIEKREEILKIDDAVRKKLGFQLRKEDSVQPWAMEEKEDHLLRLIYSFESMMECNVKLGMERPEQYKIWLNGEEVPLLCEGFYVDESICVLPLPNVRKGKNQLIAEVKFNEKTNLENLYLLGDFGVELNYNKTIITEKCSKLYLGDITRQGMPFYTGNLSYQLEFQIDEKKEYFVHIPHVEAPLLKISVDGQQKGIMAYAPHRISLGILEKGKHKLNVLLYGNRFNGFGTLHNANENYVWWGPNSYRTTGDDWTDAYMLKKVGIMDAIEIECKK